MNKITEKTHRLKHGFRRRSLKRIHEYHSWMHMKGRCYNKNHVRYKWYGARGITVCQRWRNSFLHFLTDVGFAPTAKHTIDRIDNDGNYEPGNVKWSTPSEQMQNTRRAKKYRMAS